MADHLDEQVSALVDGELSKEECKRVMDGMRSDADAESCWCHYHLISDALKKNLPDTLSADFATRVSKALDCEPPIICAPAPRQKSQGLTRPAIGFAMAASVAAVAYLGFGGGETVTPGGAMSPPQLASNAPVVVTPVNQDAHEVSKVRGRQWDVEQPAVASRLNDYLLSHGQYSAVAGMQRGVMPQVRIVGYERHDATPLFRAEDR